METLGDSFSGRTGVSKTPDVGSIPTSPAYFLELSRLPESKARARIELSHTNSMVKEDRSEQHRNRANPLGQKEQKTPPGLGGAVLSAGEF